jgi:hypothetical protein
MIQDDYSTGIPLPAPIIRSSIAMANERQGNFKCACAISDRDIKRNRS